MALTGGDITVAHDDRGSGEPAFLFMPGWCAGQSAFDDLAARMANRRALAMDWRSPTIRRTSRRSVRSEAEARVLVRALVAA